MLLQKLLIYLSLCRSTLSLSYSLVDLKPDCYFKLGPSYCPAPRLNYTWSDIYMGYWDRVHMGLVNAVRSDPLKFKKKWWVDTYGIACNTSVQNPLRWDTGLQQAAVKESEMLNESCPFQHDTCSKYVSLYGGSSQWFDRVTQYQPSWWFVSENIAMINQYNQPLRVLLQFIQSKGHCDTLFSPLYNALGVANNGLYWTQDFANIDMSWDNPIYDGVHWFEPNITLNKIRFMSNYYYTVAPSSFRLVLSGVSYKLNNTLGKQTHGVYSIDIPLNISICKKYYFEVNVLNKTFRMPEVGLFCTYGIGKCNTNYVLS